MAAAIASRQWGVGEPIPTEPELAHQYGMSIGTVRKAIELLIADGLVDRIQGKGTFVRRPTFSSSLFRFFRTPGGSSLPMAADSAILDRSISAPPKRAADALGITASQQAVKITRLRSESGQPLLYEEIWLLLVPFTRLVDIDEGSFGPLLYPLYEEQFGIVVTRAREHLTVSQAPNDIADFLHLEQDRSAVVIERTAYDQSGRAVEWRRSYGAASKFHYQIDV